MVTVDISDLEAEDKKSLPDFIENKLMVKSDVSENEVTFEDSSERTHVTSPEIRAYLKRFMHTKGIRKRYRLLSMDGTLKFVKLREDQIPDEDKEEDEKKSKS
jgi:hypothetical protein